jgi:LPS-assembly protein
LLSLSREESLPGRYGTSMERLSTGATWRLPYTTRNGQVITTSIGTRLDGYHLKNFSPLGNAKNRNDIGRVYPFASVQWRYPFVQYSQDSSWLVQPIGMIVSSPKLFNYKSSPIEDSNSTEIDDRSLFLANRFDGIDKVDTGHRFIGGFEQDWKFTESRNINLFLGQTYRLDNTRVISEGLGEDNKKSDYIGRLVVRPSSWFASRVRSAIYPKIFRPRYTEVGFILGKPIFEADVGYAFLNKRASSRNQMISQVFAKFSSKFHDNWSLSAAQIRNMKRSPNDSHILGTFGSLIYQDDCMIVDLGLFNKKYHDRDIKPDKGFLLQFTFKNLGTFSPFSTTRYPGSMLTQIR